ncbi:YndM family protein [Bacillus sp. CMF12]|uniref:YndM family protein n=1 Tax=Bacillaceae TaxID=186817 RepID=UPI001FB460E6|nr:MULTISPECIES: YndM family protein [Bacillaceae]UOE57629.1 YndM family protein [Cytobacillus oceanisediminis]USK52093.1 YndM family protein [Bacillus sp. CMF12]
MLHSKAISLKFMACLVLFYIILGKRYGMSFENIFIITALLVITSYILGDMLILRRTNNAVAAIADFGWAFLLIWFLSSILTLQDELISMSLAAAFGSAIFEYAFHLYLVRNLAETRVENDSISHGNLRYNTENSEDLTPLKPDGRSGEGQ